MTIAISFASQKGGVGKTTLALNVSLSLATMGFRVLLVDVDPQGGIGVSLKKKSDKSGLKSYLSGTPLDECTIQTRIPGLSVLPLFSLYGLERAAISSEMENGLRLQVLVDSAKGFDIIVFDTPAGLAGSTLGALRASDLVFTPLQAEPLAASTFPQLLEVLGDLREEGARVSLAGIILTMVQTNVDSSLKIMEAMWSSMPDELVLDAHIPRDSAFLKASELGVPLGLMSRRPPPIAHRFDELAAEIANFLPALEEGTDDEPISLFL